MRAGRSLRQTRQEAQGDRRNDVAARNQPNRRDRERHEGQKVAYGARVRRREHVIVMLAIAVVGMMAVIAAIVLVMLFGSRDVTAVAVVMPRRSQRVGEQIARQDQPRRNFSEHDHPSANCKAAAFLFAN
jgi:hypothetical protein